MARKLSMQMSCLMFRRASESMDYIAAFDRRGPWIEGRVGAGGTSRKTCDQGVVWSISVWLIDCTLIRRGYAPCLGLHTIIPNDTVFLFFFSLFFLVPFSLLFPFLSCFDFHSYVRFISCFI